MSRIRSFQPDALGRLEDRALLSSAATARGPVVLPSYRLNIALDMVRRDFELFATSGDSSRNFERLRAMLAQNSVGLPFHQQDAVGKTTNAILNQMQKDIASGVPHPVALAHQRIVAAIHAEVQKRVDDGSVVVR